MKYFPSLLKTYPSSPFTTRTIDRTPCLPIILLPHAAGSYSTRIRHLCQVDLSPQTFSKAMYSRPLFRSFFSARSLQGHLEWKQANVDHTPTLRVRYHSTIDTGGAIYVDNPCPWTHALCTASPRMSHSSEGRYLAPAELPWRGSTFTVNIGAVGAGEHDIRAGTWRRRRDRRSRAGAPGVRCRLGRWERRVKTQVGH
jgi:hypothetical protein